MSIDPHKPFFAVVITDGVFVKCDTREGHAIAMARTHAEQTGVECIVVECTPKHRLYKQPSVACEEIGAKPKRAYTRKPKPPAAQAPQADGKPASSPDSGAGASQGEIDALRQTRQDELPDFLRRAEA